MLPNDRRKQLDDILVKMSGQNAPQEDVQSVVNDFLSKYDVKPPEEAARQAGSIPSRIMTGLGESATETVKGIAGLPSLIKEAVTTSPTTTARNIFSSVTIPMREQYEKAEKAHKEGRTVEAYSRAAASGVPIIGPYLAQRIEAITQDPYKGGGRLAGDIGQMLLGRAAGVGGRAIGARDIPPMVGPIPGAAPAALETGSGALSTTSRMLVRSPLGTKPAARMVSARNIPVVGEAQTLLGGAPPALEQTGLAAVSAVKGGFKAATRAETALWEPLKEATVERGITVPLTETVSRAQPIYLQAKEAHDVLTSNLSPQTQRVLMQVNKQKELSEATDLVGQLPKTSMGVPTGDLLSRLPPSMREKVLETMGETPEAPPSWAAVHQARTEIGSMLRNAKNRDGLGNLNTGTLNQMYHGLSDDLENALKDHPDLQKTFTEASAATKSKKALYGTKATLTRDVMKSEPTVMPSQIVDKVLKGTPESARQFAKSMGAGEASKLSLARGVIGNILNKASGGKFGETGAILDGPLFATQYTKYRPVIKELVDQQLLDRWDKFANEVGKYALTRGGGGTTEGIAGRIASLAEATATVGAGGALATGHPVVAATAMTPLLVGRQVINIMLQPEGPGLLARYLKTGKWTPELGRLAEVGAYTGVLTPPSVRKQTQP